MSNLGTLISPNTALHAQIVCVETRSTLEEVWVAYTLANKGSVLVTGPVNVGGVYAVSVFDEDGECMSVTDRVGPDQLTSHLEKTAGVTK